MATRKRSSAVWEFFDEPVVATELRKDGKEIKKIRCKLCDLKLVDGGGTSNLSSHLQAKHPEQYRRISGGYLAIPATSVPAERIFSTAGHIVNEKRNCLNPETVDMLIFLNKNLD